MMATKVSVILQVFNILNCWPSLLHLDHNQHIFSKLKKTSEYRGSSYKYQELHVYLMSKYNNIKIISHLKWPPNDPGILQ